MMAGSGGAWLTIGGTEVSLIAFHDSIDRNGVTFSGPTGSQVVCVTGAEQSPTHLMTEHSGQFIGQSLDGPVAVPSKWKVEVGTYAIDEDVGADVIPAP